MNTDAEGGGHVVTEGGGSWEPGNTRDGQPPPDTKKTQKEPILEPSQGTKPGQQPDFEFWPPEQ